VGLELKKKKCPKVEMIFHCIHENIRALAEISEGNLYKRALSL
jgi:hypothetical protein